MVRYAKIAVVRPRTTTIAQSKETTSQHGELTPEQHESRPDGPTTLRKTRRAEGVGPSIARGQPAREGDQELTFPRPPRAGASPPPTPDPPATKETAIRPRTGPEERVEITLPAQVVHHHRGEQQGGVGDAIDHPDPKETVARRCRSLLKECDQERRGETDKLPAGKQCLDRTHEGRGDHHPEDEDRVQHEEAVIAALAVHVFRRKRADGPRKNE